MLLLTIRTFGFPDSIIRQSVDGYDVFLIASISSYIMYDEATLSRSLAAGWLGMKLNSRGSLADIPIFSDAKQGNGKVKVKLVRSDEFDEKNPHHQTAQSSNLNKENSRNTNISSKIASLVRQKREHEKKEFDLKK